MTLNQTRRKCNLFYRVTSFFTLLAFLSTILLPANLSYAQVAPYVVQVLPAPGTMVNVSPAFTPVIMRGIEIHPNNPLEFDFFIDSGDTGMQGKELEQEATKLIKYFMASITVPEDDLWVNLSPYEKDQITTETLSVTDLGRDMLAQDYLLKQLTASLMYPENELGKKFWDRVYKKAYEMYGTTDVPVNTFNKVWIYPEKAKVYVQDNMAFVVDTHLKVVLEKDYLSLTQNIRNQDLGTDQLNENEVKDLDEVSAKIVQDILLPEIEKEVNEGQNFANLRQIMNSLILAVWYKKNLRESLLGQVYADQGKVKGIDIDDKDAKEKIYQQYLEAFRQGVYDYIKEDYDPQSRQEIPRRYFSGGVTGSKNPKGEPISARMKTTSGSFDTVLNSQEQTAVEGKGKISKIKANMVENAGKEDLSKIQPPTPASSQPPVNFNTRPAEDNPQKGKGTITHQEVDSAIATAWNQGMVSHMSPVMVNEYIEYLLTNRPKLEKVLKETEGTAVTFDDVLAFARTVVTNEDLRVTDKSKKSAGGKELGASKKYFFVTNGQNAIVENKNGYQIGHIGGIRSGDAYVYLTDDINMHSSSWNQADRAFIPVLMFREAVFALQTKVLYQNAEHRKRDDDYKRIVAQGRTVAEAVEKKLVGDRLDKFVGPRITAEWEENQRAKGQRDANQDDMAWFLPETQLTNWYIRQLNASPSSTVQEKIKALQQKQQGKIRKYFSSYYNWRIEGVEKGQQRELANIAKNKLKAIRRLANLKNPRSFNRLLEELNKVDPLKSDAMGEELVMAVLNHQNPKAVGPVLEYIKASQVLPSLAVVEGLQKLGADPKTLDVILNEINDMESLGPSRKLAGDEKAFLTPQQMSDVFVEQLRAAKENRNSPLRYYVSSFAGATGKEDGVAITADWGGTNFELKLEQVMASQEKTKLIARSNLRWQKKHYEGDADILFGAMAAQIKELLNTPEARDFFAANPEKQKNIAFGMGAGFPGKAKGYSYVLADKAKEFEMTGVIGQDMGKLLQKALNAAGIKNVQVLPIMNDAEALGAMGYSAALIDGTGFGGSFYDPILQKIVNAEFGFFGDRGAVWGTNEDYIVWHDLKPAGSKMLEKQVAGGYIGEIVRLRLRALMDAEQTKTAGVGFLKGQGNLLEVPSFMPQASFSSELMSRIIKEANPEKIIGMLKAEKKLGLGDVTVTSEDAMMVRRISRLVYERAAERLAVAAVSVDRFVDQLEIESLEKLVIDGEATEGQKEELTARKALIEDGALLSRTHRNAIHGSVMEDPLMQKLLREKIAAMVETEEAEKIELVIVDDYSPGIARTALQVQELLARGENPWAEEMKDEILVVASDQKWLDQVSDSLAKQYNVFPHKIPVRDSLRVIEDIEENPARFRMVIVDSSMTIGETNLIAVLKQAFPGLPLMALKDVTSGPEEAARQEAALNEANGSLDKAETDASVIRTSVQEAIAKFEENNPSTALGRDITLETGYVMTVAEAEHHAKVIFQFMKTTEGRMFMRNLAQTVQNAGEKFDMSEGADLPGREYFVYPDGSIPEDVRHFILSRVKINGPDIDVDLSGLKSGLTPLQLKTEADVQYNNEDNGKTFVTENYNQAKTAPNFFTGIAGKWGKPMWVFYVNRGRAIVSFGIENKDNAIAEFVTASEAERLAQVRRFRTLVIITEQGKNPIFWEPFQDDLFNAQYDRIQTMSTTPADMAVEDNNKDAGLIARGSFSTMPGENYPALIDNLAFEDTSGRERKIQVVNGLVEVIPYGFVDWHSKNMKRTGSAFVDKEILRKNKKVKIYRTTIELKDSPEYKKITSGYFYFSFDKETGALLDTSANTEDVFGSSTALLIPEKLLKAAEAGTSFKFPDEPQISSTQVPAAMSLAEFVLPANGKKEIVSVYGFSSPENVDQIVKQVTGRDPDTKEPFIDQKIRENKTLIDQIQNYAFTHSGSTRFNEAVKQAFLDNVMRGGLPIGELNIFTRKHGDLERDYNYFLLVLSYLTQGNGGYRDVNQNRRNDVWFNKDVGASTIRTFMNLIQADGYNPLTIKPMVFWLDADKVEALIQQNIDRNGLSPEKIEQLSAYLQKEFQPGALFEFLEKNGIGLKAGLSRDDFLWNLAAVTNKRTPADHGEGFWIDHWTYNTDLLESFLSLYPEKLDELLFRDRNYTFYRNNHYVLPIDQRFVYDEQAGRVRQPHSVKDGTKDEEMKGRDDLLRSKNGQLYEATLVEKFLVIIANKAATFDPSGVGIEMEADKPSWYDSLNGLPGMLGSSISETIELERLSRFMLKALEAKPEDERVAVFAELADFMDELNLLLKGGQDHLSYWQESNALKEEYRASIRTEIGGNKISFTIKELKEFLGRVIQKTELARKRAGTATYFYHEVDKYETLKGQQDDQKRPYVRPLTFKPIKALPAFLEGPVHAMRVVKSPEEAREIYEQVKNSELFDKKLQTYRLNVPFSPDVLGFGRSIDAFEYGWLENASIWTHMEHKFVLELLKNGMYEEFFASFQNLTAFQDPQQYGRNPSELSSFRVSSANPNPALHGRGFVARLTGGTAEFLSMWLIMSMGKNPFQWNAAKQELTLQFRPILPGLMFSEKEETLKFFDKKGAAHDVTFEENTYAFKILNSTLVVYHNPQRVDTFSKDFAGIESYTLIYADGGIVPITGGVIKSPYAQDIRNGDVERIDVYFKPVPGLVNASPALMNGESTKRKVRLISPANESIVVQEKFAEKVLAELESWVEQSYEDMSDSSPWGKADSGVIELIEMVNGLRANSNNAWLQQALKKNRWLNADGTLDEGFKEIAKISISYSERSGFKFAKFSRPKSEIIEDTSGELAEIGSKSLKAKKGGIDLNPALLDLQIKRDGNGIPLPMNQQPVTNMKIDGFLPVIINVTPVMSLPLLLGAHEMTPDSDGKGRPQKTQASSNPWRKLGPMESKKRFEMEGPLEVSLLDN